MTEFCSMYSDRIVWNFNPYFPVSHDAPREIGYIRRWQDLMINGYAKIYGSEVSNGTIVIDAIDLEDPAPNSPETIADILDYIPTEHQTRIASNVIWWAQTNAGLGLRNEAQSVHACLQDALDLGTIYSAVFASRNFRDRMLNHGRVPLDSLCEHFDKAGQNDEDPLQAVHRNAVDDTLIVIKMINWLGSNNGQCFLNACEHELHSQMRNNLVKRSNARGPSK